MKHSLFIICFAFPLLVLSQNLVKNPSFEISSKCPEIKGNLSKDVENWSVSSLGTTDYFNTCSKTMGVPNNFSGSQAAKFGKGYAGLYLFAPSDYREYLQGELSATLKKNYIYNISFYISLSDKSNYSVKDFEILFTKDRVKGTSKKPLSGLAAKGKSISDYNFVRKSSSGFFEDREDWMLVSTEFTAKGTENFITIGNFKNNSLTRLHERKDATAKNAAYYYLDMVSVTVVREAEQYENYDLNTVYVFNDVEFKTDKHNIQKKYSKSLHSLYYKLKKDKSLYVSIYAHTDNVGDEKRNNELSHNRAREVAGFLIEKGISEKRIRWSGKGSKHPVAKNITVDGRQKNRRAEFIITNGVPSQKYENSNLADTIFQD